MGNAADMNLEQKLMADLTAELSVSEVTFNAELLLPKVQNAIREVRAARKYPDYYAEERIEGDLYRFYSKIRNIALYDYNGIGGEWEQSHSENGVSRSFVDRDKLFWGILPLAAL